MAARTMKLGTKIAAGILLGVGLPLGLIAMVEVLNPKTTSTDRENAIAGLMILGLPPSALGGWLVIRGRQQAQQQERDRLKAAFFRLLTESQGHLTVLRFAMETGLEGEAAKQYLDERGREFNASYNITEEGKFSYYFDLGELPSGTLPASEQTFDVILEAVPTHRRRQVVKEIRDLLGLEWQAAKDLVKQQTGPIVLQRSVPRTLAERYRDRLAAAGAEVLIVLN